MLYILNLLSNYVLLTSFHNILDKKRRYLRERTTLTLTYQHHPHLSFSSFFSLELVALYHRVSLQDTHSSDDQSPERIRCAIIIDIILYLKNLIVLFIRNNSYIPIRRALSDLSPAGKAQGL